MAFKRIPRETRKCRECHNRGRCSCQERLNILAAGPLGPKECTALCGANGKDVACGRTARSGVCTCPFC